MSHINMLIKNQREAKKDFDEIYAAINSLVSVVKNRGRLVSLGNVSQG